MDRKAQADAREKATGMRQSRGAMIAKFVFGVLFLISGVTTNWSEQSDVSDPLGPLLMSIILGLALIAWGLIPLLSAKKKLAAAEAQARAAREAEEYRRMNAPKVCRACGATTKGIVCEYCGTPLK